jgi:aminoglycoside N3'-acetyltransferase
VASKKSTGAEAINIMIPIQEVADQLRALGVKKGGVLLVHTSFRAVRPIEGGPLGLIEALCDVLGPDGTLVMPAWSGNDDEPLDPASTPTSPDLSVVPDHLLAAPWGDPKQPPVCFCSGRPAGGWITSGPFPIPPHTLESPVGRMYELDGQVLLLGVGHEPTPRFTWRNSSRAFRTA